MVKNHIDFVALFVPNMFRLHERQSMGLPLYISSRIAGLSCCDAKSWILVFDDLLTQSPICNSQPRNPLLHHIRAQGVMMANHGAWSSSKAESPDVAV